MQLLILKLIFIFDDSCYVDDDNDGFISSCVVCQLML